MFYPNEKSRTFNYKNPLCEKCKGKCKKETVFETQKVAKQLFGIIPNNCCPDSLGNSYCPY